MLLLRMLNIPARACPSSRARAPLALGARHRAVILGAADHALVGERAVVAELAAGRRVPEDAALAPGLVRGD